MGWLPGDDEDEEQQQTPPPAQPSEAEVGDADASEASPLSHSSAAVSPGTPDVKSYLMQKYLQAADGSGVQAAQDAAYNGQLAAIIGRGAEGFARAKSQVYGGQGVDQHGWQAVQQMGQQNVANAQNARQQAMSGVLQEHQLQNASDDEDPNSEKAKAFSQMIGKLYPQLGAVTQGMSYSQMQKTVPSLVNAYESGQTRQQIAGQRADAAKYAADSRAQSASDNAAMRAELARSRQDTASQAASDKADKATDGRFDHLTKDIAGSLRDSVGDEKRKLRSATHAKAILDGADLNNLTPEQANEIGAAMASTLAQGSPAESLVHNMTPQSAHKDLAKALEYVTGAPQGAGLGDQLKLYQHMLDRQIGTSRDIITGELAPKLRNYSDLAKKDPERFNAILSDAGIQMDPTGKMVAYQPSYGGKKSAPDGGPKSGTAYAAPAGPSVSDIEAEMKRRGLNPGGK